MEKINAVITGVGGYVPDYVLTNDEISKMVEGGKRPYQNVFKFVFGAAIAVVVLMLGEVLIRFIG